MFGKSVHRILSYISIIIVLALISCPIVYGAAASDVPDNVRVVYSGDDYYITETPVAGEYDLNARRYPATDSKFYDGLAIISGSGGYGYVDKTGKIIIPTIYTKAHVFRGGIARVVIIDRSTRENNQTIKYIDTSGNEVTNPVLIRNYHSFGAYIAMLIDSIGNTGADGDGDSLILKQDAPANGSAANAKNKKENDRISSTQPESMNIVNKYQMPEGANWHVGSGLYGYTDESGNIIIPYEYDRGEVFREGLALARKGDMLYVLEIIPVIKTPIDSPEVAGKRLPILMYHSVNDNPYTPNSGLFVRASELEAQLKYLSENGFQTITFEDLDNLGAYSKPIMLTFDDGYKDNYTILLPLLKKYNLKATVFIITDAVVWGNDEFVSTDEIVEMSDSGYISIQSHTVTHQQLPDVGRERLIKEVSESKAFLEDLTGKPVVALCYPVGKQNAAVRDVVADYYEYAVIMGSGKFVCGGNLLSMNRIYIARGTSVASFAQLVN